MRVATDDPDARCVSLSVTRLSCAETAKRIKVLFRVETVWDRRHIILEGCPDPLRRGGREWGEILLTVKNRNIACIRCGLRQINSAFS